MSTRRVIVILVGCLALAGSARGMSEKKAPADERIGWHDEVMPEGLIRSEVENEYIWEKDQSVMVYVPAGTFTMGSIEGRQNERPVHEVYLDAYYIDKHEVSWRRWKLSGLPVGDYELQRVGYPVPPHWGIIDNFPVNSASWNYANAFAEWAGKRLPTEAEWEKAARGTDARRYPWGHQEPTTERAAWKDTLNKEETARPVDCCEQGASPYGVLNMAGNVYEWCLDVYDPKFYSRSPKNNPVSKGKGSYHVVRGGAYPLAVEHIRASKRYRLHTGDRSSYVGFRLVLPTTDAVKVDP